MPSLDRRLARLEERRGTDAPAIDTATLAKLQTLGIAIPALRPGATYADLLSALPNVDLETLCLPIYAEALRALGIAASKGLTELSREEHDRLLAYFGLV